MRGFKNQESSWLNGKVESELNRWIVSIIIILHPFSSADPFQGRSGAGACHSYQRVYPEANTVSVSNNAGVSLDYCGEERVESKMKASPVHLSRSLSLVIESG